MKIIKSRANRFAAAFAFLAVGIYFLGSGLFGLAKDKNSPNLYSDGYSLKDGDTVNGELWCVDGIFGETDEYLYYITPITSRKDFDKEIIKFVAMRCPMEYYDDIQSLIDFWNGEITNEPDKISFVAEISEAGESVNKSAYVYFEETYSFDEKQANEYYEPYLITVRNKNARIPRIIIGGVLLTAAALLLVIAAKTQPGEPRVFTEADVPISEGESDKPDEIE